MLFSLVRSISFSLKIMQRLIKLPSRVFTLVYHRTLTHDSGSSTTNVRMGLPFAFDDSKALNYFNRWRKSFW